MMGGLFRTKEERDKFFKCTKKNHYQSKKLARDALLRMRNTTTGKLRVYHCPYCGGFHIGGMRHEED